MCSLLWLSVTWTVSIWTPSLLPTITLWPLFSSPSPTSEPPTPLSLLPAITCGVLSHPYIRPDYGINANTWYSQVAIPWTTCLDGVSTLKSTPEILTESSSSFFKFRVYQYFDGNCVVSFQMQHTCPSLTPTYSSLCLPITCARRCSDFCVVHTPI